MWFVVNQEGERVAVESREEAIRLCNTDSWYVEYLYSNCGMF